MSNIDLSQLITADDKAALAKATRQEAAKLECRRRILAVCDETAQVNLAAAVAAGLLSEADLNAYRAGLAWVADMRGTWAKLAEDGVDLLDDANWPAVPDGVQEIASQF